MEEKIIFKAFSKTVKIIDEMIVDALLAANDAFPLPGGIPLSHSIDNLEVMSLPFYCVTL